MIGWIIALVVLLIASIGTSIYWIWRGKQTNKKYTPPQAPAEPLENINRQVIEKTNELNQLNNTIISTKDSLAVLQIEKAKIDGIIKTANATLEATNAKNAAEAASMSEQRSAALAQIKQLQGIIEAAKADSERENQKLCQIKANFRAAQLRVDPLFKANAQSINIDKNDAADIDEMRHYCRGMRCENEILKALYVVYVRDEMARIVQHAKADGVSGIYRIFTEVDGKEISYIGQSVNIGERWKQHAKRAWGIDDTGRIKLYREMMRTGIDQWKWEIVEVVSGSNSQNGDSDRSDSVSVAEELSAREVYWGEFYCVKEYGLNTKLG